MLNLNSKESSVVLENMMNGNYKSLVKLLLMDKQVKKNNPDILKSYGLAILLYVRYN